MKERHNPALDTLLRVPAALVSAHELHSRLTRRKKRRNPQGSKLIEAMQIGKQRVTRVRFWMPGSANFNAVWVRAREKMRQTTGKAQVDNWLIVEHSDRAVSEHRNPAPVVTPAFGLPRESKSAQRVLARVRDRETGQEGVLLGKVDGWLKIKLDNSRKAYLAQPDQVEILANPAARNSRRSRIKPPGTTLVLTIYRADGSIFARQWYFENEKAKAEKAGKENAAAIGGRYTLEPSRTKNPMHPLEIGSHVAIIAQGLPTLRGLFGKRKKRRNPDRVSIYIDRSHAGRYEARFYHVDEGRYYYAAADTPNGAARKLAHEWGIDHYKIVRVDKANPEGVPLFCADCEAQLARTGYEQMHDGRYVCPRCAANARALADDKRQKRFWEEQQELFDRENMSGYRDEVGVFHPIRASKGYNEFKTTDVATLAEQKERQEKHDTLKARDWHEKERKRVTRPGKYRTLSQWVRARGGIAPHPKHEVFAGEMEALRSGGRKRGGRISGLINKDNKLGGKRASAEYVMDAANVEGYRDRNGQRFENIGDFLSAVGDDASGIRKHYTQEEMSSNPKAKKAKTNPVAVPRTVSTGVHIVEADINSYGLPSYFVESKDKKRRAIFSLQPGGDPENFAVEGNMLTRDEANEAWALVLTRHDRERQYHEGPYANPEHGEPGTTNPLLSSASGATRRRKQYVEDKLALDEKALERERDAVDDALEEAERDYDQSRELYYLGPGTPGLNTEAAKRKAESKRAIDRLVKERAKIERGLKRVRRLLSRAGQYIPGPADSLPNAKGYGAARDLTERLRGRLATLIRELERVHVERVAVEDDPKEARTVARLDRELDHLYREIQKAHKMSTRAWGVRTKAHKRSLAKNPVAIDRLSKMFHGRVSGAVRNLPVSNRAPGGNLARLGALPYIKMEDSPGHADPRHACERCAIVLNPSGAVLAMTKNRRLVLCGSEVVRAGKALKAQFARENPRAGNTEIRLGRIKVIPYITAEKHSNSGQTIRYYHSHGEDTGRDRDRPELRIDRNGTLYIPSGSGNYTIDERGIIN